jgi:hypothetical protein
MQEPTVMRVVTLAMAAMVATTSWPRSSNGKTPQYPRSGAPGEIERAVQGPRFGNQDSDPVGR